MVTMRARHSGSGCPNWAPLLEISQFFERIRPQMNDADEAGRVLLSQVEFTVTIHRQQVPFGSTVADFDASEFEWTVKSLCSVSPSPVIEMDLDDWVPRYVVQHYEHPTGMRFRLEFELQRIIGRSYAAYGVVVEREFP